MKVIRKEGDGITIRTEENPKGQFLLWTQELQDIIDSMVKPNINDGFTNIVETATDEEIAAAALPVVPDSIPRMKFIMQVFFSTGKKYEEIIAFIEGLQSLDDATKYIVLTRLRDCTTFERYSQDFIMIANMMGISDSKKDEIFLEGNKLN